MRKIQHDVEFINEYKNLITKAFTNAVNKKDYREELILIQKSQNRIIRLLDDLLFSQTSEIVKCFNYAKIPLLYNLLRDYESLINNKIGIYEETFYKLKKCLFNPFSLFYQGISCILAFTISPLIKRLSPNFNTKSMWYNGIATLISIISGIITIIVYFQSCN